MTTDPAPQRPGLLRRSLPARLTAAFLTLSVATVLASTLVSYWRAEAALRTRLLDQLADHSASDARRLTEWIDGQRALLAFLSGLPAVRTAALDAAPGRDRAFAATVAAARSGALAAAEVRLLGVPGGRVLFSTDPASVGGYAVDELHYQSGRDSTVVQPLYASATTGLPTITVATPVRDPTGRTRSVLAAHLELDALERVMHRREGDVPIDDYLVSPLAELVAPGRLGDARFRRGVRSPGIDRAIAGENGRGLYRDHEGRPVVGAWRWLPELQLALVLESPQGLAFAPAQRLLLQSLLVGLLAAALLTVGVVVITRRAVGPVLAVATAAERVAAGDLDARAPALSADEVGQLAGAFNTMTGELRRMRDEREEQVAATRRALAAAQHSRALLQDVVDGAALLIVVLGPDGRVRLANARADDLLGTERAAAFDRPLEALPRQDLAEALRDLARAAAARGRAVEQECQLTREGEPHVWQLLGFPLRDAAGATYATALIGTDLTERARQEEERRQRDANVQQAQKLESLGIMAGGIAHDFNNILGAVLAGVDVARAAGADEVEAAAALDRVAAAGRRAADLTRQMLAYAGRASLRREVTDIRDGLQDIVTLVRAAQPKKVDLAVAPMPEPLWVELDPAQLSQVVLNLLTNACEAIGDATGTVRLTASAEPGRVRIVIEDTGVGMTPDVQQRIFEPFFSTKASGRGLGLSAVRGIVESLGGALHVRSRPGGGSRFEVVLTAAAAPAPAAADAGRAPAAAAGGTILVVDDEPALRWACRRGLERAGYTVLEAGDGIEGMTRFEAEHDVIRLVVLDLTMPGMDGTELLARLRERRRDLPVIVASGYDRSDRAASLPSDARTRFLQKPFALDSLRGAVADLLG